MAVTMGNKVNEAIEGIEYRVIGTDVQTPSESDERSTAQGLLQGRGANGAGDTLGEYARALQTFGAGRKDRQAALEVAILGWLDAKRGRSGSMRTWRTYAYTLASFRAALQREGLDLDGPVTPVALVAQAWAGSKPVSRKSSTAGGKISNSHEKVVLPVVSATNPTSSSGSTDPANTATAEASARQPAPATYNQRLASVSSFYKYARKQGILEDNPIERVDRRRVQAYAGSRALEAEYVKRALASIDRATPIGARDYALLLTYLQTGRRLSEVAAMECRDLEELHGSKLRVTFRRCKGGKILHDTLTPQVSGALLAYLYIIYRLPLDRLEGSTPVWVSLAERNGTRGGRLSKVSISRICKTRLGTTRVHMLRSTMAQVMEKKGAPVSLIQQRLAHSSLATTGIYLASLRQDDNPYADELSSAFGVE